MLELIHNFMLLLLEAAPGLVIGLLLGGLIQGLFPTQWLQKHLNGSGFGPIIKAALLGAPLPLCSCGVIPAALGLRKAGASKPATVSFLVSTPETGVDSIAITYAMMGPIMAIIRPVAAVFSAVVAGLAVAWFDPERKTPSTVNPTVESLALPVVSQSSCCQSSTNSASSCCGTANTSAIPEDSPCGTVKTTVKTQTLAQKAISGIRYAFTQIVDDIMYWLLIGMVVAAVAKTFIPPGFLTQWGSGIASILIMILISIPTYTCATASTPMAAGLMLAGVSPGVTLMFLLTGPATNVSTIGVLRQTLGQRSMWLYLASIIACSTAIGWLVDSLVDSQILNFDTYLHAEHELLPQWLAILSVVLMAGVSLRRFIPSLPKSQTAL